MSIRVLIIDDDEQDLKIINKYLQQNGFDDVHLAQDGAEGLTKVNDLRPQLVITDTNLPDINGFEICHRIKNQYAEEIKVIVMTGLIDAVDASKAKQSGADEYCAKSVDCSALLDSIKKVI